MATCDEIMNLLREVPDPEMPISIVDLGIVERVDIIAHSETKKADITVEILPTFVGCPALPMIRDDIITKLRGLDGVNEITVNFIYDPPWSVDRISDDGRASLRSHGVTVPETGSDIHNMIGQTATVTLRTSALACPFCGSNSTRLDSSFGPTRCRMIYYCESCRNTFEHMKRV